MIINKSFNVETAHIVRGATSERCKYNIHGHSYKIIISLSGEVKDNGMVLDFIELKPFIKHIDDIFDHSTVFWMNEDPKIIQFFRDNFKRVVVMTKNPTAENMASFILRELYHFINNNKITDVCAYSVEVYETINSSAIAYNHNLEDTIHAIEQY